MLLGLLQFLKAVVFWLYSVFFFRPAPSIFHSVLVLVVCLANPGDGDVDPFLEPQLDLKGIRNLGQTCISSLQFRSIGYMSAMLQCLVNTESLKARLEESQDLLANGHCPYQATLMEFIRSYHEADSVADPTIIHEIMCAIDRRYMRKKQEDSHEALMQLLEAAMEENEAAIGTAGTKRTIVGRVFESVVASQSITE